MEKEFFDLYERQSRLAIEVGHNSIADWGIQVYDRKGKGVSDYGAAVVSESCSDRSRVFACAYIALTKYLSETRGGY